MFSTKKICRAGIIAAFYVVLTFVFWEFSFAPVQLRVSEMLTILPLFYVESVPALYVGCILANVIGQYGGYDIGIGSLATLIAALLTYFTGRLIKNKYLKFPIGALFPVLSNAFIIPVVFILAGGDYAYWFNFMTVGIGEALSVYILGGVLYFTLLKLRESDKTRRLFD